jgi:hypothetical protein
MDLGLVNTKTLAPEQNMNGPPNRGLRFLRPGALMGGGSSASVVFRDGFMMFSPFGLLLRRSGAARERFLFSMKRAGIAARAFSRIWSRA